MVEPSMVLMQIGFDDTDSLRRGCTTYIAALLVEKLHNLGVFFIDYPNLIRLNPNVPWKTRGNGALCLRVRCRSDLVEEVTNEIVGIVKENSDLESTTTDPGIVILYDEVPEEVKAFAQKAIRGVVRMNEALRLSKKFSMKVVTFKEGRGVIGSLAAIGETLDRDHTYEILTYRMLKNRGTPRKVEASTIIDMNEKTRPFTFNNIEPQTGRILITPRGPDPVLYGIRGETPKAVKAGHDIVQSLEEIERWVIFRTNQGTDAHLFRVLTIHEIEPFNPVIVRGVVSNRPKVIQGGHVIFSVRDKTAQVDCAAYEPTADLRKIVKNLIVGDLVEVCGGVRSASLNHPTTINLEKIRLLKLTPQIILVNPTCPQCLKRMKSMGTMKGYRCSKCGFRSSELNKTALNVKRNVTQGLYITPPRSQRHLTKPFSRYGLEKITNSIRYKALVPFNQFYGNNDNL